MKVTQEKLPASKIGLEIEISPEMSKNTYEKVIKDLSRTANIPGFRKGKVPRPILLQRMGTVRIKVAALEELIQNGLEQAIKQESIEALGNYQLLSSFEELIDKYIPGEPLIYKASVDVEPEVQINDYKELKVKAEEVKPDQAKVDKFLEERRSELATLIPVEGRPAQKGDVAVVDYVLRWAGQEGSEPQEVPGGKASNYQIELLDDRFVPGFVDGIIGMNAGETKEIQVRFADDYTRQDLAGQETIFTVTLQELKEKELPELNDDFAQEVSDYDTLAELRQSVEDKYKAEAERQTKANKERALLDALTEKVEMEIPESLMDREIDFLLKQTAMQLGSYGLDFKQLYTQENLPQMRERSRPEAIERIKQAFALKQIAKQESLEVTAAEIDSRIEEVMSQLGNQQVDPVRVRQFVSEDLVREKALAWLEENASIELVAEGSLSQSQQQNPEATETSEAAASEGQS